jgi:hypothetical protein
MPSSSSPSPSPSAEGKEAVAEPADEAEAGTEAETGGSFSDFTLITPFSDNKRSPPFPATAVAFPYLPDEAVPQSVVPNSLPEFTLEVEVEVEVGDLEEPPPRLAIISSG